MRRFICNICGFVYDEAEGYPDGDIPAGTLWEDLPDTWVCPLCTADKSLFRLDESSDSLNDENEIPRSEETSHVDSNYTNGEIASIFSNLSKGLEKQYKNETSALCQQLADYFTSIKLPVSDPSLSQLVTDIDNDSNAAFTDANQIGQKQKDRGALRALKWAEQVTRMNKSHLSKLDSPSYLEDQNVYVCQVCGFIYVGDQKPDICPVCKVPNMKLSKIVKEA